MLSQRAREAYGGIEASALNLNVVEASRANVARLKALLRPRSSDEHLFFRRFIHLPFILEHRSHSWAAIKGQTKESPGDRNWKGKILSLLELAKLFAIRPRKYTRVKDATKRKWLVPGTEIEPANPEIGENFHFTKINVKSSKKPKVISKNTIKKSTKTKRSQAESKPVKLEIVDPNTENFEEDKSELEESHPNELNFSRGDYNQVGFKVYYEIDEEFPSKLLCKISPQNGDEFEKVY